MYEFHYDYIKRKYGNNLRILFNDTDSLMHETKIQDINGNFSKNKEMFYFSDFSIKSKH